MDNNKEYVLTCIDGSSYSVAVCEYATWIAQSVGAPINFLHTIEQRHLPAVADLTGAIGLGAAEDLLNELTEVEQNSRRLFIKKGNLMLQAAKQKALDAGVDEIELSQEHGNLAEALVEREAQIRVLVIGIRGLRHENDTAGVGTQLESVIRSLHKPILVVNQNFSTPKLVMLAYDGGDAAIKALDIVASSPLFKNIPCHLVHVSAEGASEKPEILETAAKKLNQAGIGVHCAELTGDIELALTQYQAEHDIDLTIMGAFSHNRVRDFLLGSFTVKMLKNTQRPLLLLR